VFTIFLCGIIVTYVGNASNYKEQYESARSQATQARGKMNSIEEQWTDYQAKQDKALEDAKAAVAALRTQVTGLEQELASANTQKNSMLQRVESMAAKMESAVTSTDKQRAMYEKAQQTLDELRAEQIRLTQDLKETNDVLIEKLAIIATQDEQLRRLTEMKNELTGRLESTLRAQGKAPGAAQPATALSAKAQPAGPIQNIDLKGRITDLDLENALAEISIGSESGVQQKMRFHVTRGSEYLCDIHVVAVDTDKAVGSLEFVQGTPRIGDPVATNF
jgi:chromosome segregation ATPase